MLTEIGSLDNVPGFLEEVKGGSRRLMGFGHRVYKSYDPRAKIIKRTAYEVFEITGKNPRIDIALELERVALQEDYFVRRRLYPNVDFYSGIIYEALGFPVGLFPVLFARGCPAGSPSGRRCCRILRGRSSVPGVRRRRRPSPRVPRSSGRCRVFREQEQVPQSVPDFHGGHPRRRHDEQNCSTSAMRGVGSSPPDPKGVLLGGRRLRGALPPARAAMSLQQLTVRVSTRSAEHPQRGRAEDAARYRDRIARPRQRPRLPAEEVKGGSSGAMGFGHQESTELIRGARAPPLRYCAPATLEATGTTRATTVPAPAAGSSITGPRMSGWLAQWQEMLGPYEVTFEAGKNVESTSPRAGRADFSGRSEVRALAPVPRRRATMCVTQEFMHPDYFVRRRLDL